MGTTTNGTEAWFQHQPYKVFTSSSGYQELRAGLSQITFVHAALRVGDDIHDQRDFRNMSEDERLERLYRVFWRIMQRYTMFRDTADEVPMWWIDSSFLKRGRKGKQHKRDEDAQVELQGAMLKWRI